MARTHLKHLLPEQARKKRSIVSWVGLSRAAYLITKRTMDIVISLVALIFLSPVLAIAALLIKSDSPGPALFKQIRIGKDGVPFTLYKFRGMFVDAQERFPELYDYTYEPEELETLVFHQPKDPRVTPMGKILRKASIDELPNLINVLKGDMSLVGPRPEIPELVAYYGPSERMVLSVKPGVTSLAKVQGRDELNFRETLSWDLYYVKHQSLWLDLEILFKTIIVVLKMDGVE